MAIVIDGEAERILRTRLEQWRKADMRHCRALASGHFVGIVETCGIRTQHDAMIASLLSSIVAAQEPIRPLTHVDTEEP